MMAFGTECNRRSESRSDSDDTASFADWNSEVERPIIRGIFSGESDDVHQIWQQCRLDSAFDFEAYILQHEIDMYQFIRLVNYLRYLAETNQAHAAASICPTDAFWSDDTYLRPVIANDPLLQTYEDNDTECSDTDSRYADEDNPSAHVAANGSDAVAQTTHGAGMSNIDVSYFDSYRNVSIHHEMLMDKSRTLAYQAALKMSRDCIRDKVVLDVGCGTGVLSMFAAAAGARHVYAIEATDIAQIAQKNIDVNGLSSKITILHGTAESVALPVDEVDLIVSEWMGYGLLFENMLPSVLHCRDRFLSSTGKMFPSSCRLYIQSLTDLSLYEQNVQCWDNMYGLQMPALRDRACREAHVLDLAAAESVCGPATTFYEFDCHSVKDSDLDIFCKVDLDMSTCELLYGFVISFDCTFDCTPTDGGILYSDDSCIENVDVEESQNIILSTRPERTSTHWKQVVLFLPEPLDSKRWDSLRVDIAMTRMISNSRAYDIRMQAQNPVQDAWSWQLC